MLRSNDIKEYIGDLIAKESKILKRDYKRMITMLERYRLNRGEPIDDKFVRTFLEKHAKLLESMDHSSSLKLAMFGGLPKQMLSVDWVRE